MLRIRWNAGLAAVVAAMLLSAGAAVARPLSVEVWTDRGDDAVYSPGEQMLVKARTNDDAYLLVYEIDAEGNITVLFPFRRGAGMVEGRNTLRLPPEGSRYELAVEGTTGQGFLVAIASREPFRDLPWYLRPFDPQAESIGYADRHDEVEGFDDDGRVLGDPYVAIERIRRAVLGEPDDVDGFATSYASYYVGHPVRYPRYLCYDCHRPNRWSWWDGFDPYYTTCSVIDFRVNWNWCWGPCLWSAHTPYYYYTVRHDCPPHYRRWYDRRDRWSSWDGRRRWDDLWGGPLTRHKSAPPPGYVPPTAKGDDQPRTKPPGFITTTWKGAGGREYLPVGRNRPSTGDENRTKETQTWRTPAGSMPPKSGGPPDVDQGKTGGRSGERVGTKDRPRFEPPRQTSPKLQPPADSPRRETPKVDPPRRDQPRQEQPRRESPKYDPPRQEQPRREAPKVDPPRQQPKQESPRQDPPKQDSPKQDKGSSGGQKHKGGGGR